MADAEAPPPAEPPSFWKQARTEWPYHSQGYHMMVYGGALWIVGMVFCFTWHVWLPIGGIILGCVGSPSAPPPSKGP